MQASKIKSESYVELLSVWPTWRQQAIDYVMSLREDGGWGFYHSKVADKPIAISSANAVLLLGFLDSLDIVDDTQKKQWGQYLLTSLGTDGLCCDKVDLDNPTQPQPLWALRAHRTRHIAWAIELLGMNLQHSFEMTKPLYKTGGAKQWLNDLMSDEIPGGFWAAGNWIMDMGVLLDLEYRHFGNKDSLKAIHELMDTLDEIQDDQTGYWFAPGDDLRCGMAGAMHLYPMYWAHGREVKHIDRIVENTLSLQQSDGLFGYEIGVGGSQCLDYDAILVLVNLASVKTKWNTHVAECCKKVLDAITVNHQSDGSFADCQLNEQRYWATQAANYDSNGGSLWDTYARLMTIAMCIKAVTGSYPARMIGEHHWFEIFEGGFGWDCGQSSNQK